MRVCEESLLSSYLSIKTKKATPLKIGVKVPRVSLGEIPLPRPDRLAALRLPNRVLRRAVGVNAQMAL